LYEEDVRIISFVSMSKGRVDGEGRTAAAAGGGGGEETWLVCKIIKIKDMKRTVKIPKRIITSLRTFTISNTVKHTSLAVEILGAEIDIKGERSVLSRRSTGGELRPSLSRGRRQGLLGKIQFMSFQDFIL
jgi:hypothetical protein